MKEKMKDKGVNTSFELIEKDKYNLFIKKNKTEVVFEDFNESDIDWSNFVEITHDYNESKIREALKSPVILKDYVWIEANNFLQKGKYMKLVKIVLEKIMLLLSWLKTLFRSSLI